MKNKLFSVAVILIAALAMGSLFIGCEDPGENGPPKKNTEAELSVFTFAGHAPASLPDPISAEDYLDESIRPADFPTADVKITLSSQLTNAVIEMEASKGATKEYAIANNASTTPDEEAYVDISEPVSTSANRFVFAKITSEDGQTTNYYRFKLVVLNTDNEIRGVTVAGVTATIGVPGATWQAAQKGSVQLNNSQIAAPAVIVVSSGTSVIKKIATAKGDAAPDFTVEPAPTTFTLEDEMFIYIEATAENLVDKKYYKIEVEHGRVVNLSSVVIKPASGTNFKLNIGNPSATWANVSAGLVLFEDTAAQNAAIGTLEATVLEGGSAKFAKLTAGGTGTTFTNPSEPAASAWAASLSISSLATRDAIGIEVSSANGKVKMYYIVIFDCTRRAISLDVTKTGTNTANGWKTNSPGFRVSGNNPFVFSGDQNQAQIYLFEPAIITAAASGASLPGTGLAGDPNYEKSMLAFNDLIFQWEVSGGEGTFRINLGWNFSNGTGDILWDNVTQTKRAVTDRNGFTLTANSTNLGTGVGSNRAKITGFTWQREGWVSGTGNGWTLNVKSMYLLTT